MSAQKRSQAKLLDIPVDDLIKNDDNPRLFFRDDELDALLSSIAEFGIQVPLTVYKNKAGKFVLIDGERRWRCAKTLNLETVPAIVQQQPTPLENLLLMFNIHALREQWDYFTIANKLPVVKTRFREERGIDPNEIELSRATGLTRGQIRRCLFLLDLPEKYKRVLVEELSLPKKLQKLSEDFFIEMERSLKTVQGRVPSAIQNIDKVREALIGKFRKGTIRNITDFRMLSKIATSIDNLDFKETKARKSLEKIFDPSSAVGIEEVYVASFGLRYDQRKISLSVDSIIDYLKSLSKDERAAVSDELRELLAELRKLLDDVLED